MAVEVDIMECLDPTKKPAVNVPPLNHIGLWVDDLKACVKDLEAKGMRFTPGGIRAGAAGYDVCFIHPKVRSPSILTDFSQGNEKTPLCGQGVLIELVQAPKEVIDYYNKL